MMEPNAVQSDFVVVEYQTFDGQNAMVTLAFDFLYVVVGHVQESQFVQRILPEYVGGQFV